MLQSVSSDNCQQILMLFDCHMTIPKRSSNLIYIRVTDIQNLKHKDSSLDDLVKHCCPKSSCYIKHIFPFS